MIAFRSITLVSMVACLAMPPTAGACGDANGDQKVTAIDALVVLRASVGIAGPCDRNCDCDVSGDRELTITDALGTLQMAVRHEFFSGACTYYDGCFDDEDCETGLVCGTDPDWECDAACVPD